MADSLEKTKKKYQSRLKRMEQQILQHLLHNQLATADDATKGDESEQMTDNDSIGKIEMEAVNVVCPDNFRKSSDLVTSWIQPSRRSAALSLLSDESDDTSD